MHAGYIHDTFTYRQIHADILVSSKTCAMCWHAESLSSAHAGSSRVTIRSRALPFHILVPPLSYLTRRVLQPGDVTVCVSMYDNSMSRYHWVRQHLPKRLKVLGACRIECTFLLHHMDRTVYLPYLSINGNTRSRVKRRAFPMPVRWATSYSSSAGVRAK
jgi:hypothetical protein